MAQSRREQLQAYRFMQRRVRTALLDADPDTNDAPLSRMGAATYAGIMVAILVLAGAGIYGVFVTGGSSAWQKPGALIVEKETSTRYIYQDDVLYQVANVSSARLLLGDRLKVVTVSRGSLAGARHGGDIGIPGAPDYVPEAKNVVGTTWSVCVTGLGASAPAPVHFEPGVRATGQMLGSKAMLLSAPGGTYLVYNSHAFLLPAASVKALSYGDVAPVRVDGNFITALAHGQTLRSIVVAGSGRPGPKIGDKPATVGEVLRDRSVNKYYLVLQHSVQILTPLQKTLQLSDPRTPHGATGARKLSGSSALSHVAVTQPPHQPPADQRGPLDRPDLRQPGPGANQLCTVFAGQSSPVVVLGAQPAGSGGDAAGGLVRLRTADGALVSVAAHAGQAGSVTYLVSDTSQKFPLTAAAVDELGLRGVPTATLRSSVVNAIPTGPVLDPAAARRVVGAGVGPAATPS